MQKIATQGDKIVENSRQATQAVKLLPFCNFDSYIC